MIERLSDSVHLSRTASLQFLMNAEKSLADLAQNRDDPKAKQDNHQAKLLDIGKVEPVHKASQNLR